MGNDNLAALLPELIQLTLAAGKAVMKVYNTPFDVEYKEDKSPLTLADKLSHEIICTGIKKQSSYPILSEEMAQAGYETRKDWKTFWLVDPLDGTKEFVKRNGEFTINIALIKNNMPVMGFIYLPVHKTLYYALKNRGSYRMLTIDETTPFTNYKDTFKTGEKLPLKQNARKVFTIIASRSHNSLATEAFIAEQTKQHGTVNLISAGSSIKFCKVAEGEADAYPRFAPTMEWDTAAGQIIAEEAGKKVTLTDNITPLSYNKPILLNPHFVVF